MPQPCHWRRFRFVTESINNRKGEILIDFDPFRFDTFNYGHRRGAPDVSPPDTSRAGRFASHGGAPS